MQSLKSIFFLAILAFAKSSPTDCTVDDVNEIESVLKQCNNIVINQLHVPSTGNLPVFNLDGKNLTINGKLTFDARYEDSEALLTFTGEDYTVQNGPAGLIDGNGALYWDGKGVLSNKRKPVLIKVEKSKNANFNSLLVNDCPQACVEIRKSDDVVMNGFTIDTSSGDKSGLAVDTHGITIKNSSNVNIKNGRILNQGECVSVNQGHSIRVFSLDCIGSQGAVIRPEFAEANFIRNISFEYVFLTRTQSGIRIVTSPSQPEGTIDDVSFNVIQVTDTEFRGIEIRQDYGNEGRPLGNIKITNLNVASVTGYMTDKYVPAVYIYCGNDGCANWQWSNINIKKAQVENSCNFIPTGFNCW
ncbi:unnamed protein product [Phyllotreta striolata]|uniref:Glycoside hydrolase family 28 n=1 Tax=Phyllotreta striolata TaxID=444603 RepID=A0A9N9TDN2_PHYSR|nr:unnamed protein product [Phyllotreta striolata]